MNDQQQSRADALTEEQIRAFAEGACEYEIGRGVFRQNVATVGNVILAIRNALNLAAASPVEQPALLTAQDALAAIETFEIVGDNNDSREPNAEDRFTLTEFVAHLFGGFRVELPAAAPADERAAFDLAEFCELIDAYQCAQKDGTHDERAKARFALMNAYRAAASPAAEEMRDAAIRTVQAMGLIYTPGSDRWRPNAAPQPAQASPAAERVTAALQALSADVHTLGDGWANDEAMIGLAKKYLRVEPKPASPELSLWRDFVLLAVTDTAPQPAQADAQEGLTAGQALYERLHALMPDWYPDEWGDLMPKYQIAYTEAAAASSAAQADAPAEAREAVANYVVPPVTLLEQQKRTIAERHFKGAPDVCRALQCIDDACAEMLASAPADAGEAVAIVRRQPNGAIAMFAPDGKPFDMSAFVGATFYTAPPAARVASLTDEHRSALEYALSCIEKHGYESGSFFDDRAKYIRALLNGTDKS